MKMMVSLLTLLFVFFSSSLSVEAANPITSQQSRVTYTLKDMNGVAYKVYFAGVQEKKAVASYDRDDWAAVSYGVDEGDQLYKGNYTLYTHNPKTSHIKKSNFYFKEYLLNTTRKTVHIFPSKYKGQPDILAVAYSIPIAEEYSSEKGIESADWYYMKNGVLTQIRFSDGLLYSYRAQIVGKNTFLTAFYDPMVEEWYFAKSKIDPSKTTESLSFPEYNNPNAVLNNWKKDWK
jgi:hypothetical protein